jgi:geranylgeranyl diphosphate synthase type I
MPQTTPDGKQNDFILIRQQVNDFLLAYCQKETERADALHANYKRLWAAISDHIEGGGKRLRPYLVVMTYEAFGGTDRKSIVQAAAAWELIHVAMLMHDDIIDRDYVRHGHPNVAGNYLEHYESIADDASRRHHANSSALLAGDLLISAAYDLLFNSGFSPAQNLQACRLLHEAIFTVVGGELLDVEASVIRAEISPQLVAEAKTASYSLIGPMLTGASLAGASETAKARLRELGLVLGVGFQYVDDVLGIFGDEAVTGKSVLSDLEEGKRTFVVSEALELMSAADRERAEHLLHNPSADAALELRDLIKNTDVQSVISAKIADFHQAALGLIGQLELGDSQRALFERMTDMILKRRA